MHISIDLSIYRSIDLTISCICRSCSGISRTQPRHVTVRNQLTCWQMILSEQASNRPKDIENIVLIHVRVCVCMIQLST